MRKKKEHERKDNMPFWWQQLRKEISLAQVIPERGLRPPLPQTLLPMQPARTLGKGMPKPADPHKNMPNLWPMGTLKMDCPQGSPDTLGEVPTSQTWRVECPQGRPGASGDIPTSPQNPSPSLRELFQ